jgi:hypothetical protein
LFRKAVIYSFDFAQNCSFKLPLALANGKGFIEQSALAEQNWG